MDHTPAFGVDNVQLAIDARGAVYWNGAPVDRVELKRRMQWAGKLLPQPELHLRADKTTQYQALAEVMAEAAKSGLTKIGFVSDPDANR